MLNDRRQRRLAELVLATLGLDGGVRDGHPAGREKPGEG